MVLRYNGMQKLVDNMGKPTQTRDTGVLNFKTPISLKQTKHSMFNLSTIRVHAVTKSL